MTMVHTQRKSQAMPILSAIFPFVDHQGCLRELCIQWEPQSFNCLEQFLSILTGLESSLNTLTTVSEGCSSYYIRLLY